MFRRFMLICKFLQFDWFSWKLLDQLTFQKLLLLAQLPSLKPALEISLKIRNPCAFSAEVAAKEYWLCSPYDEQL